MAKLRTQTSLSRLIYLTIQHQDTARNHEAGDRTLDIETSVDDADPITEEVTQHKAKTTSDKSNRLRSVLRLRGRALLPGPQYLNTRCKIYRVIIRVRTANAIGPRLTARRGHSRPRLAIDAMERDKYWTTMLVHQQILGQGTTRHS